LSGFVELSRAWSDTFSLEQDSISFAESTSFIIVFSTFQTSFDLAVNAELSFRKLRLDTGDTFIRSFGEEESGKAWLAVSFVIAVFAADSAASAGSLLRFIETFRTFVDTNIVVKSEGRGTFQTLGEVVLIANITVVISAFVTSSISTSEANFTLSSSSFDNLDDTGGFGLHDGCVSWRAFSNAVFALVLVHSNGADSTVFRLVHVACKAVRVSTRLAFIVNDIVVESFLAFFNTLLIFTEDLRSDTLLAGLFFTAFSTVALAFFTLLSDSIVVLVKRAGSNAHVVGEFIRSLACDTGSSVFIAFLAVSVFTGGTLSLVSEGSFRAGLGAVTFIIDEAFSALSTGRNISTVIAVVLAFLAESSLDEGSLSAGFVTSSIEEELRGFAFKTVVDVLSIAFIAVLVGTFLAFSIDSNESLSAVVSAGLLSVK
jgi:hypothetical protein